MIFREEELLFRGSKDRLKRNVARMGGDFPAPGQFRILWRSRYFKWGLTFRMTGSYESVMDGILIRYRFVPSAVSLLWTGLPLTFLLSFALWELADGNMDSAAAVVLFSMMYPAVAVWQYFRCRKEMYRYFSVVTG